MESKLFMEYLENNSPEGLASIPKSDLHNHASNGGNVEYVKNLANIDVPPPPPDFASIAAMEEWAHANIKRHVTKFTRYEAAFAQAKADGIFVLALSVFRKEMDRFGTCEQFIQMFNGLKNKHLPDAQFIPEIAYSSEADCATIDIEYDLMDEILSHNYFKSIDLCCCELTHPVINYKNHRKIFAKAKNAGLVVRAHVGEYGTADDVMRAVEELELDEVNHGIGAASSPQVMKWLADHKIRLNVCPTSNLMLDRATSYKEHPIRKLFDYGVPVTVNSDNMLIFNQSVSREYLNLYNCGLMSVQELDEIRLTGLGRDWATGGT